VPEPLRILGLSGSLQEGSSNAALIRAAVRIAPPEVDLKVYRGLAGVPALNPELDDGPAGPPEAVAELRAQVAAAEGLLIATPEYGHSMPGVLKNALDWFVASGELANMPIAILSASPTGGGGIRAQMALITTLLAQSAQVTGSLWLPAIKQKLDDHKELVDTAALRRIGETLTALGEAVSERRDWLAEWG
jgi:chromate reductase